MKLNNFVKVKNLIEELKDSQNSLCKLEKYSIDKVSLHIPEEIIYSYNTDLISAINTVYKTHLVNKIQKLKISLKELGVETD